MRAGKGFYSSVVALVFSILCVGSVGGAAAGETELAHAIFVRVNGQTITQEQVVDASRFIIKREFNGEAPNDEEIQDNIQKAALRDLVRTALIFDEARRNGVTVGNEYSKRAERMSNMKPEEITPTIRRMLIADDVFDEILVSDGVPIREPSPRDLKEFYSKNRDEFRSEDRIAVRTIFLANDPRRPAFMLRSKAEEIMREVAQLPVSRRTTAFANQARQFSEDVFARYGGLLTADAPERMIPKEFNNISPDNGGEIFPGAMYNAIQELNRAGDMRVAESDDGLHLVYLEALERGREMAWSEVKPIIEYILGTRERNRSLRAWLSRVYDRSDVRWHDGTPFEKSDLTEILLPSERTPRV